MPSGPSGALHTSGGWGADRRVVSKPGRAPPPPTGTVAGSTGALHTSGVGSLIGASSRSPARSRRRPLAPRQVSSVPSTPVGPGVLMGSALEGLRLHARKSSPCALKMAQIQRFCTCWAKFFAEMPVEGRCWANFIAPTGAVPRSCSDAAHLGLAAMGILRHAKPSSGVSSACRSLAWRHSPRLVAQARNLRGCGRQSADPLGENR